MTNGNPIRAVAREANRLDELLAGLRQDGVTLEPDELDDLIEGETERNEILLQLGEIVQAYDAEMLPGIKGRIEDLTKRKRRIEHTIETYRALILSHMERTSTTTIAGPLFTMSARATARALVVENEAEIPSTYFAAQDPRLDRKALSTALKDGAEVPGAKLDNGGSTLSIRVA